MEEQAAWVSCLRQGPLPPSSQKGMKSCPDGSCALSAFVSQLMTSPEFMKHQSFYNGLQGNLPNLCPKGDIILIILNRQQALPSALSFKVIYYWTILENMSQMSRNVRDPWRECLPTLSIETYKCTDNVLSYISLCVNTYNNLSDIFIKKDRQGHFQNISFAIFMKYFLELLLWHENIKYLL